MKKTIRTTNGFTLLELLIVLAIAAILAAIAAPSFNAQHERLRSKLVRDNLFKGIQLARSEAVKRSKKVVICASKPSSEKDCASGNWNDGWLVFVDEDGSNSLTTNDVEILVYEVTGKAVEFDDQATPVISFRPTGVANIGIANTNFGFCYFNKAQSHTITLSPMGRVKYDKEDSC